MEDGAGPLLPWSEQLTKWLHEELPHLAPQPYRVPSHAAWYTWETSNHFYMIIVSEEFKHIVIEEVKRQAPRTNPVREEPLTLRSG